MLIAEVALWGVSDFEGRKVAILKGTDNRGYFVHEDDPLWDGRVLSINVEKGFVVFEKEQLDKASIAQASEVVKSLH